MNSPVKRRTYSSPLRAEQAAATRRRILDAAIDHLAATGDAALAIGDVATAANVSERTVYNHFGSLEGLVDAVSDHLAEIVLPDPPFRDPDTLVESVREAWRLTPEQERVFRAAYSLADRTRDARYGRMRKVLKPLVADLGQRDAHIAMAAMFLVRGGAAYQYLRDYGATPDEAADAMAWLLQLAIDDLRQRTNDTP